MKLFREINPVLKPNPRQTFIGIWFHDDNLEDEAKCKMELYLTQIFYYYRIFTTFEDFITYLVEKERVAKIYFIISILDPLIVDALTDLVQNCPNTEKYYGFGPIQDFIPNCFNASTIDNLFTQILQDIVNFTMRANHLINVENEADNKLKPMNISRTTKTSTSLTKIISKVEQNKPIHCISKESNSFLNFRTMTTILLRISYNDNEISDMWRTCRELYPGNCAALVQINTLQKQYTSNEAIRYYTKSSHIFLSVNQACRTENLQRIYQCRVYIRDMDMQIRKLHIQQTDDGSKSLIRKVYRGKVLSACVLQQLIDNKDDLISMNGFLSTSLNCKVADIYSGTDQKINESHIPVRFIFIIDNVQQPYANISKYSVVPDEEEILFSLGTIWCIKSIKFKQTFYQIELEPHNTLNDQLDELLQKYATEECTLSLMGDVLREMGNYDEAEWFYQKALKSHQLSPEIRGQLHFYIGLMRKELDNDFPAVESFNEAARLLQASSKKLIDTKTSEDIYTYDTNSILIAAYNNMATLHEKNGDFDEAITCCYQALEVDGSQLDMAKVRNKLGRLYFDDGNYEQARKYFADAVTFIDESYSCWTEFGRNFDNADQYYKQSDIETQKTDISNE